MHSLNRLTSIIGAPIGRARTPLRAALAPNPSAGSGVPALPVRRQFIAFLLFLLFPLSLFAATPSAFEGRWRLDTTHSTALDGWTAWDLVVSVNGPQVSLQHDMQWRSTKVSATNIVDTAQAVTLPKFFRVEQRHMALYPEKDAATPVRAAWLDDGRTLRIEADAPIEISQGRATMRIYSEYRLIEGGTTLVLIELHSSRSAPLVYRFTKVTSEK